MKQVKSQPSENKHNMKDAVYAQAALAMVGLHFDLETSLLIKNTMSLYLQMGVKFSLNDAARVCQTTNEAIQSSK